eukprot:gene13431-28480_t
MPITETERKEARARINKKYREKNLEKCRELARVGAKRIYDNDIENKRLFELSKLPSYDKFKGEFVEKLDSKLLQIIYDCETLKSKPEIKANLKNIIDKIDKKSGELKVKHNQRYNCGRFYADESISLIPLSKYIKHTVFKFLGWLDIDMVKGHPSIAIEMGKSVGIHFPAFEYYVNNFDEICKCLSEFYSGDSEDPLGKDNIKWLFNSMIYGGGFPKWIEGVEAGSEDYSPKKIKNKAIIHPIIKNFKEECKIIMDKICSDNTELLHKVSVNKKETYEKKCSTCSYWFQIIENHIVYVVAELLLERGILKPCQFGEEYDGLNIPPCESFDKDLLTAEINNLVKEQTGLHIKFKFKDYDNDKILYGCIETRNNTMDSAETISFIMPIEIKYFKGGENNVAREISTKLKNTLVFTNERWVICDNKTKLWRYVKDPTATIITHIQNGIDESRKNLITLKQLCEDQKEKEKYVETEKEYLRYYVEYGKNGVSSQVKKCLQEYLHESFFSETLDNNIYKVAYKNGILDLKTLNFRYGIVPEDRLTKTIPYDYEIAREEDIVFVREELKKICNYKDDHLDYYLSAFGYAMTGDSSKLQNFWTITGQKASNGKSVIFEALTRIMPNYIIKLENTIFETTYGSRHKEIATWGGARIAWVNEMSKRKQDADFIKNLSDGTPIRFKVMYGEMDNMPVTFKLFTVGNNTISIDADNGVARRMRGLQMDSDFVEGLEANDYENKRFILDRKFGDLLATKYKHAIMGLIYKYSHMFATSGNIKPYPNDWKDVTDDVCKENNKFTTWFDENFEVGEECIISKGEFDEKIRQYTGGKINIKDELKRMRIKFKYDSQKREKGQKGFYIGFKISKSDAGNDCIEEIP